RDKPDDEVRRTILADALEEAGNDYVELIRLQMVGDGGENRVVSPRERQLIDEYKAEIKGPFNDPTFSTLSNIKFEKGFAHVRCIANDLNNQKNIIIPDDIVEKINITMLNSREVDALLKNPVLEQLKMGTMTVECELTPGGDFLLIAPKIIELRHALGRD